MVLKLKQPNTFFLCCQFVASERHNLHGDLCLIDPPVIGFDGESLLNALLYGSDESNDKINREILLRIRPNRAGDTGVAGDMASHPFVYQKEKKETTETKKEFQSRNY